jgi:hypothetical protein
MSLLESRHFPFTGLTIREPEVDEQWPGVGYIDECFAGVDCLVGQVENLGVGEKFALYRGIGGNTRGLVFTWFIEHHIHLAVVGIIGDCHDDDGGDSHGDESGHQGGKYRKRPGTHFPRLVVGVERGYPAAVGGSTAAGITRCSPGFVNALPGTEIFHLITMAMITMAMITMAMITMAMITMAMIIRPRE